MGPTGSVCHIDCQLECDAEPCPQVRARYPQWLRWEYCTHTCSCPDCQCERWVHHDGIHAAPVRQVEDSEDEAACQPTQQLHESQANTAQDFVREEFVINGAVYQPIQHGSVLDEEVAIKPVHTASQPIQQEKVAIPCGSQECWWITEKDEPDIAIESLLQHFQQHHPQPDKAAMDISTKEGSISPAKYTVPVRQAE